MVTLENVAKNKGFIECELSISLPSRDFYQSLGYKITKEHSKDAGEGQNLNFWSAKKTLNP